MTTCMMDLSAPKRIGHSIPIQNGRVNDDNWFPVPFSVNVVEGGGMGSNPTRSGDFRLGALYIDPTAVVLVPNQITR